jgi:catechol 2,3-dioxygenase-like lactoylglutathione lyase family enzyme
MLDSKRAFSGFAVNSLEATKHFYGRILGLKVESTEMGLQLHAGPGNPIFIYHKPDHVPASYTILNFPVSNIDQTVTEMSGKGVRFEHYDGMTDDLHVARGRAAGRGPDIAWFKDPSGNILSVLQSD